MRKIGFGIIGAGMIAEFHAKSIASLANAKLCGFFDERRDAAKKRAGQFHCRDYATLEELLSDPEVEAVTVATPSGLHHLAVLPAARAHKHILCEKPLEITVEKCDELIRCCKENDVFLVPVFQTRFTPAIRLVKEAMDSGRFGKMLFCSVQMHWFRDDAYYASSNWRGTWAIDGGGVLMNQAIHHIDQMLYINGAAKCVRAVAATKTHAIEVEDNLAAVVEFANGSFGTIEVSTSCRPGFPRRIEFVGDCGSAVIEEDKIVRWVFDREKPEDGQIRGDAAGAVSAAGGSDPRNIRSDGHSVQIGDLADAIAQGRPPLLNAMEGRRCVDFICGIYDSVKTGKPHYFER
ncbi:MAG: Gfo/Idh/MocA family oxidoreductase [Victivallaceae bacterium]|nr:Gfo/Idh/MocA family oxidoreductase [Victivallaceae bacterium]